MRIDQLQRWHMEKLSAQEVADASAILAMPGYVEMLMEHVAFAGVVDEGICAAVGMVETDPRTWRCWGVTDPKLMSKHFLAACIAMRHYLEAFTFPSGMRVETVVEQGNARGMRWVENILGFTKPVKTTTVRPDGTECSVLLYERR